MNGEYKSIKLRARGFWGGKLDDAQLERMMNDFRAQGWESAAALDTSEGYGSTRDVVVIFKTQK